MNKMEIKIEVTDHFAEGSTEFTKIEKMIPVVDGQLTDIIDVFVSFMNIYGFHDKMVAKGFSEWLEEYEDDAR